MSREEQISAIKQREIDALNQQVLELSAQVERMRDALTAIDNVAEECEGDDGELVFSVTADAIRRMRDTLSIPPSAALLAHDNEVAAKALEDAAKWFDDNYIKVNNSDGIIVVCKANELLRRLAAERRNRK